MAEPRFLLDGMLGSLARWLRIMGYDAMYVRDASDADMLARLVGNDRTLLTRDRQLADRAGGGGLYLEEGELEGQLLTVVERFGLSTEGRMARCSACNGELEAVGKEAVAGLVEAGTLSGHAEFWRCRDCGKIFWQGAHWRTIRDRLQRVSRGPGSGPR
ncbi:MAG TPA: Mut7-C RNAse domain-containing protein [Methanomassiliicoccales archaeon]|nr:Mut7-C RNAse domain-containing protein [Methanomassiliicoccales archaeon]